MKTKSHSGLKKRIKIKKSGFVAFNKPNKRHLLVNKSKRQKKSMHFGVPVKSSEMKAVRRLMGGRVKLHKSCCCCEDKKDAGKVKA